MLHDLMSMLYLDVLDLDYIIAVKGLNGQMNGKKQEVLKSDRMKKRNRYRVHRVKNLCRKTLLETKLELENVESIPNNAATHMVLHKFPMLR